MKKAIAILLVFAFAFSLFACTGKEVNGGFELSKVDNSQQNDNIIESVIEKTTEAIASTIFANETEICSYPLKENAENNTDYEILTDYFEEYITPASSSAANLTAEFALKIFKKTYNTHENALISPVSILLALCLAAEGADGQTLEQMEKVMGSDIETLRSVFSSYIANQKNSDELRLANSVWLNNERNRLSVAENFINTCKNSYNAEVFSESFDDKTAKKINKWVSKNTDGTIDSIIPSIPSQAVMYLINTVLFEAEWQRPYYKGQVVPGSFNNADGSKSQVEMMVSDEYRYFSLGKVQGIIKDYKRANYAFVAMLPDEGTSLSDAVASLNSDEFIKKMTEETYRHSVVRLPKFEFECAFELPEVFKGLGMTDAFDFSKADFSKMGSSTRGNLFINNILHKTYIKVAEKGTKAGAATVIEVADSDAPMEPLILTFDRPFIFAIIEKESGMPIFLGTVTSFK